MSGVEEEAVWAVALQLLQAMHAVHGMGMAVRGLEPSQRIGRRLALSDGPGAQRRRQCAERTAEPRWNGRGRSYRRRRDAGEEALGLQLRRQ